MCSAKAHVLSQFAAAGIDTARVDLLPLAAANSDHLGTYAHMDISLDPFPYAGTTTTCESLYMGVPVVTLQGAATIAIPLSISARLENWLLSLAACSPGAVQIACGMLKCIF